jgi:hypothetical protein
LGNRWIHSQIPSSILEQVEVGIVPGAQQSPEISNWLQDEILARTKECPTAAESLIVDDKMPGVLY